MTHLALDRTRTAADKCNRTAKEVANGEGDQTNQTAVSLRRINVTIGSRHVVRDVSLAVRPGEFLTLLGPSGCGKTSTLRAIAGYLFPDSGTVEVGGTDVTTLPPQKRSIGMVFQNYALFPHLSVFENIAFSLRLRRLPRAAVVRRVGAMLDLVRLAEFATRYPRQLSGGQQQRVAVARALAFEPRLLLLDEPLSALDRHLREELQVELKRIQQELGITTIFVTHDQAEALALSDRIAIMSEGEIEQLATPSEIYELPKTKFVASFLGKMQFLSGTAEWVDDHAAVVRIDGLSNPVRCALGSMVKVGQRCLVGTRPENVRLTAVRGESSSDPALVRSVRYLGTYIIADVEIANGLRVQGTDFSREVKTGEKVGIEWQERGMVVFDV
jgi:spermidine/putrescine ABC transporter ATP-binding subunit